MHSDVPANGHTLPALQIAVDPIAITEIIRSVVQETVAAISAQQAALPDKLAFTESEAARLLSLHPHQLRDARLRGEIHASVGPGRRVLYTRADLQAYLASRRWTPA